MGADGFGSSLIIALAAFLWIAYFIPTWLRRREYLATERNAIRLQQTLRILAETAEIPEQIRAETSARSAAEHERSLKKQLKRTTAIAEATAAADDRAAVRLLAESQPSIAADVVAASSSSRRLRRSRATTTVVLLAALVAVGVGVAQFVAAGVWPLLASGVLVTVGSVVMLGQMASVGRARVELARTLRARQPAVVEEWVPVEMTVSAPVRATSWTPIPLPKPLYMGRPAPERSLVAALESAAELRQATADAERRLRVAVDAGEVTPIRADTSAVPASVPSRFARMGIVEQQPQQNTDLDAVLRRRRSLAS